MLLPKLLAVKFPYGDSPNGNFSAYLPETIRGVPVWKRGGPFRWALQSPSVTHKLALSPKFSAIQRAPDRKIRRPNTPITRKLGDQQVAPLAENYAEKAEGGLTSSQGFWVLCWRRTEKPSKKFRFGSVPAAQDKVSISTIPISERGPRFENISDFQPP